jgi:DNA-binding CsgD family transcriptional regulator
MLAAPLAPEPGRSPLASLTHREGQVLALMAEGRSNQAIGERLAITKKTVESHVRSIFFKLGLPERATDDRRVLAVLCYLQAEPSAGGGEPSAETRPKIRVCTDCVAG